MNSRLRFGIAAVLLGTGTLGAAQPLTREQSFAAQISNFQDYVSFNPYTFKPWPKLRQEADAPMGSESFADRFAAEEAESSNSSEWQRVRAPISNVAADPMGNESFGGRFAEMQAASSDSGEFAFHPGANVLADVAGNTRYVAVAPRSWARQTAGK